MFPTLAELVGSDWEPGDKLSIRYYVFPNPIDAEAVRRLVARAVGAAETEFDLAAYSEQTGLEWKQELEGGYDFLQGLKPYIGKFAVVIVEPAAWTGEETI